MPGRRPTRRVVKKKKPAPAFSVPGQRGWGHVKGSKWRITREADTFTIKRPPKKPKVIYR